VRSLCDWVSEACTQKQGDLLKVDTANVQEQDSRIYVRSYRAAYEDMHWAPSGVMARVANRTSDSKS
jgi:hypothetical protein